MSRNKKLTRKEKIAQQTSQPVVKSNSISSGKKTGYDLMLGLVLAAIAFALYINTVKNGYVFDDVSVITANYHTQKGVEAIPLIFKSSYRAGYWIGDDELYRPLSLAVFAVQWELWPDNPAPAHMTNILAYALLAFLLYFFLRKLLRDYHPMIPFLATLIFTAHPIHTEVVANIKSLDELLSSLLIVSTLILILRYLDEKSTPSLVVGLVLFFLSFLAKESAITILAVIPLMLYCFRQYPLQKILTTSAVFVLPAAAYLLIRRSILGSVTASKPFVLVDNLLVGAPDFAHRLSTAMVIMGKYMSLLFFPHPLSCDYSFPQFPIVGPNDLLAIGMVLLHAALLVYAILNIKKQRVLSFAILFYFITMSIYSNIFILIGSSFGERFLFVPTLGFALAVTWLLAKVFKAPSENGNYNSVGDVFKRYAGVAGVVGVAFLLYAFKTVDRNKAWESHFTLFSTDVHNSPRSARIHYLYGTELMQTKAKDEKDSAKKQQYLAEATKEYTTAVQLHPRYADAYGQLGLSYYRRGDSDKAFENYNKSIELKTSMGEVYSNLGVIYFNAGDLPKALELFQKCLRYNNRFGDGFRNLGSTYGEMGQLDKALDAFLQAVKWDPKNAENFYYLAITYEQRGEQALAQQNFNKAFAIDPELRKRRGG